MLKRFLIWIGIKQSLHERDIRPPYFKEGELWWAHIGENIGSEVDGKGDEFTRPVIVFRKLGAYTFLAVPTSTKKKEGTWYVAFRHKGIDEIVLLSQVKVVSFKRLKEKIGELDGRDMDRIREAFRALYH
jgi:mRNA-degrading endonuclease toxin of MazEF toxin-antitoxin module